MGSEIFITIVAGLILSGLTFFIHRLWLLRKPRHPIEITVDRFVDDYWFVAFPEKNPNLKDLDGVSMGCPQSYAAMIERGGVDIYQTKLRIKLRSLIDSPILIKQIYIDTEKREVLSGTKIHCENAGSNRATILAADLDEAVPSVWEAEEDDMEIKRLGSFPFFSRNSITLSKDNYETLILVGRASRYCVSWRLRLEFELNGYSGFIVIDSKGKPFRTTGVPPAGFTTNLEWAWHAKYRILPAIDY